MADSAGKAHPSMRQDRVMQEVIIEVMMAMTRGNALLITFPAQPRQGQTNSEVMSPFITGVMRPLIRGYSHRPDRPSL